MLQVIVIIWEKTNDVHVDKNIIQILCFQKIIVYFRLMIDTVIDSSYNSVQL